MYFRVHEVDAVTAEFAAGVDTTTWIAHCPKDLSKVRSVSGLRGTARGRGDDLTGGRVLAGGACDVGTNLGLSGIDYALTGAAGATLVAPFVTAVPVAEVWVNATAAPEELYDAAKADPVNDGQNVVFLQAKNDAPLIFREMTEGLWVANRFRLYADLRRDPRGGREQAERLREEVIGF